MLKSNDDSDDSFTSINIDIQNTIHNENSLFSIQIPKDINPLKREGTYNFEDSEEN
jgi:hypothetical protein